MTIKNRLRPTINGFLVSKYWQELKESVVTETNPSEDAVSRWISAIRDLDGRGGVPLQERRADLAYYFPAYEEFQKHVTDDPTLLPHSQHAFKALTQLILIKKGADNVNRLSSYANIRTRLLDTR